VLLKSLPSSTEHVVCRQGPPDPLQFELPHWLEPHGILDCDKHTRTDKNLPWFCLIARICSSTLGG
jgi:hypothetical protein